MGPLRHEILLRGGEGRGYPTEYLLARIGGRRGALVKDFRPFLEDHTLIAGRYGAELSEERAWRNFTSELVWLHTQMEGEMRAAFAPAFIWFELRTLVLALRYKAAGERRELEELLAASLLSVRIQRMLTGSDDPATAVTLIGRAVGLRGAAERYRRQGVQGFEEELRERFLEQAAEGKPHPVVAGFVARLVDMRNLLAYAKRQRWGVPGEPVFLRGGTLRLDQVQMSCPAGVEPAALEERLLAWLTRQLRREGHDPTGEGALLDYLWRRYLEARNLAVILRGGAVAPAALAGAVIS